MIYILKNKPAGIEKYEYILFDSDEKTRCSIETTPEKAIKYSEKYGFEAISPLQTLQMWDYKEQSFGDFFPLPF